MRRATNSPGRNWARRLAPRGSTRSVGRVRLAAVLEPAVAVEGAAVEGAPRKQPGQVSVRTTGTLLNSFWMPPYFMHLLMTATVCRAEAQRIQGPATGRLHYMPAAPGRCN